MAHNVAAMRFPDSYTAKHSFDWISAIDARSVRLSEDARKIFEKQKASIRDSDSAIENLKTLDLEIANLMAKRNCVYKDIIDYSKSAIEPLALSCRKADGLYKAFGDYGFRSTLVRNAVSDIRKIFFDDSLEVYKEIQCVNVDFERNRYFTYRGGPSLISFEFEHVPSAKCFAIMLPVLKTRTDKKFRDETLAYGAYYGDSRCSDIYGIYLVRAYNNGSSETIAYHYDLRIFKKQFEDFVNAGFENPVPRIEIFETYSYYGLNDKEAPIPMSRLEFLEEGQK